MRSLIYRDEMGIEIELRVPWPSGTDTIPPPAITFVDTSNLLQHHNRIFRDTGETRDAAENYEVSVAGLPPWCDCPKCRPTPGDHRYPSVTAHDHDRERADR